MSRRMSTVTVCSDFDFNSGKSLQESGVLLCNQDYFQKRATVSFRSPDKLDFQRKVDDKDQLLENIFCEGLVDNERIVIEKRRIHRLFKEPVRQDSNKKSTLGIISIVRETKNFVLPKGSGHFEAALSDRFPQMSRDKIVYTAPNINNLFRNTSLIEKTENYVKDINSHGTQRRKSVMERRPTKLDKRRYSESLYHTKVNNVSLEWKAKNQSTAEVVDEFPVDQWEEAVQRHSENIVPPYVRANMNTFPDIFISSKTPGTKKLPANKTEEFSLSDEQVLSNDKRKTNGLSAVKGTSPRNLDDRNGIAVSGLPAVWSSPCEVKKTYGCYDVRQKYADNIEKTWYENFQKELKLRKGVNDGMKPCSLEDELQYSDRDTFGYSSDMIHKNSLFSKLRGEYESSLSNDTCKTVQQNREMTQLPYSYREDNNIILEEFESHSSDTKKLSYEEAMFQLSVNAVFSPSDYSVQFTSEDFHRAQQNNLGAITSASEAMIFQNCRTDERWRKQSMETLKEQRYARNGSESESRQSITPELTLTEIRALRLKLKKYSQFQKSRKPLKGKRRFRQIVFVVVFAQHFTNVLLKSRERKRKLRTQKTKTQNVKKERDKMYSPFERNKTLSRRDKVAEKQPPVEEQLEEKISRFERELNQISQDYNEFAMFSLTLPRLDRARRPSDPGPSRPKDFHIILSPSLKIKRKRKCTSANASKHGGHRGNNSRYKQTSRGKSDILKKGLVAEIKLQLSMKTITKTDSVKMKPTEIIIVKDDMPRRHSLDDSTLKNGEAIDLRSLLKDINIPAKEIKIQIAERKMKRRKAKLLRALNQWKEKSLQSTKTEQSSSVSNSVSKRKWSWRRDDHLNYRSPFVTRGMSWNQKCDHGKKKPIYDKDLLDVSSLVLEMRSCRYIRWNKRYQDVLSRLDELELSAM